MDMAVVAPSLTLPRIAGEGTEHVKWKSGLGRVEPSSLLPAVLLARHPSPVTTRSASLTSSPRHRVTASLQSDLDHSITS